MWWVYEVYFCYFLRPTGPQKKPLVGAYRPNQSGDETSFASQDKIPVRLCLDLNQWALYLSTTMPCRFYNNVFSTRIRPNRISVCVTPDRNIWSYQCHPCFFSSIFLVPYLMFTVKNWLCCKNKIHRGGFESQLTNCPSTSLIHCQHLQRQTFVENQLFKITTLDIPSGDRGERWCGTVWQSDRRVHKNWDKHGTNVERVIL